MSRECGDWLENFMELTSNSEPPVSYRRWVGITTLAAALQRKCWIEWGNENIYPNLYVVLVGPPGRTRKGTAMKFGRIFLNDIQVPLSAESVTREALIKRLESVTDTIIDPETNNQIYHSSLTVFSPELTVFLGHNNFQLMSDLTDWFDCADKWTYDTKNSGTNEVVGVWVNLLGATTPDLIRTALPLDAIGGGLTSRIIFIFEPNKGKTVPAPFWGEKEKLLAQKLSNDLHKIHAMNGQFKFTQAYIDLWIDWYTEQDNNPPFHDKRFAGYFERRGLHARKLSMICNVSRTDTMILDKIDFERALTFLEAAERKMPMAFTGVGKSSQGDTLTEIMSEIALRKELTVRDLMEVFYIDVDPTTLEQMLRTLEMIKFITIKKTGQLADHKIIYSSESTSTINEAIKACAEGDG